MFNAHAAAPAAPQIRVQSGTLLPGLVAILLGVFIIGTVGFSHIDVLHNAAHDVRHANGYPCH